VPGHAAGHRLQGPRSVAEQGLCALSVRALTIVFWVTAVPTVGWVDVSSWNYNLASGLFGEKGSRLATTVLMGASALLSGLLVLHHRRGGGEEYWTGAELVYALVMFVSVFYGIYSFFGWFFYAWAAAGVRETFAPIRESRVTRPESSASSMPSVPGGRSGRTM
jgi:hypothetical protein